MPLDLLAQDTLLPVEVFGAAARPSATAKQVARVAALLEGAARPAIVAGGGARAAAAGLRDLVERLDGYLVTTAAGKGVLPEAHPANLGCSLPYAPTQRLLAEADIVLAVGTGLSETDIYTADRQALEGRLIRVDIRDLDDERHPAVESVCSDAAPFIQSLLSALDGRGLTVSAPRQGWRTKVGAAATHRAAIDAAMDAPTRMMQRGLAALRRALPPEAAVFSDMTQIAYLGNYAFPMDAPGGWHHPSGYGTLGFAMPAALGAKIASPDRPVLALHGEDYSPIHVPHIQAKKYLLSRGITDDIIEKYGIGFATDGEYGGRIIVPSYDKEGELNFFVSRAWFKTKSKYKNPQSPKELIIFNESLIDWNKPIYLCEGVFDSFFLNNSIPLLGKHLPELLFGVLYDNAKSDIIICLDGDAFENAKKVYQQLNGGKLQGRIKILKLPNDKDVCDLKGEIKDYFYKMAY
jgi:hypothetical protein